MEVLSDFIEEEVEEGIWSVLVASTFGFGSDLTQESIDLILGEELWDPTRGQEIVNVNEELVISDLGIS